MNVSKSTFYRTIKKFKKIPLYKIKEHLIEQGLPGRKPDETPLKHVEKVIQYRLETRANDKMIARILKENEGIEVSHCKIYKILKSASLIHMLKNKRKKKTWVRWERKHTLSLWQTDWTTFKGKWLMVILDDASRLVVGWGLFDKATSENSVKVIKEAIEKHGRPRPSSQEETYNSIAVTKKEGRKVRIISRSFLKQIIFDTSLQESIIHKHAERLRGFLVK